MSTTDQLHHNFRSRYLIDALHQLGYCSSYAEVTRFERNIALASGSGYFTVDENTAVLVAEDNVDHDVCTLDGKNTFHGMGMIAAITPKIKIHPSIHRCNVGDNIKKTATVDIKEYRHVRSMLRDISF